MPVTIGLQVIPQHGDFEQMKRAWVEADAMGVDRIYNWDHFYPLSGDRNGKHFESLTVQAAMAALTEKAEVSSLVICNSYRNPNLLADMARTIDHISGGRFVLGIGSGWFQHDYDEYGYEFGTAGSRLDDLAAAMPRLKSRLTKLNPPPTRDIPVLIGGQGERKTLRLVAEYADIWHGFTTLETYPAKAEILARHCADVGRDPDTIERSAGVQGDSLDALLKQADAFVDLGVTKLTVGVNGPDYDLTHAEALCRWRDRRQADGN